MGTALHVKSPRAVVRAGWPLVARSRVLQERRKERIMNERNDMQAKLGTADRRHTILIIGISRGIGRGLAAEYLRRGWFVIGTVRSSTVAPELEAMAAGDGWP
jgi:hypothetical protein